MRYQINRKGLMFTGALMVSVVFGHKASASVLCENSTTGSIAERAACLKGEVLATAANLMGPAGPQGPQGAQGLPGVQGPQGLAAASTGVTQCPSAMSLVNGVGQFSNFCISTNALPPDTYINADQACLMQLASVCTATQRLRAQSPQFGGLGPLGVSQYSFGEWLYSSPLASNASVLNSFINNKPYGQNGAPLTAQQNVFSKQPYRCCIQ